MQVGPRKSLGGPNKNAKARASLAMAGVPIPGRGLPMGAASSPDNKSPLSSPGGGSPNGNFAQKGLGQQSPPSVVSTGGPPRAINFSPAQPSGASGGPSTASIVNASNPQQGSITTSSTHHEGGRSPLERGRKKSVVMQAGAAQQAVLYYTPTRDESENDILSESNNNSPTGNINNSPSENKRRPSFLTKASTRGNLSPLSPGGGENPPFPTKRRASRAGNSPLSPSGNQSGPRFGTSAWARSSTLVDLATALRAALVAPPPDASSSSPDGGSSAAQKRGVFEGAENNSPGGGGASPTSYRRKSLSSIAAQGDNLEGKAMRVTVIVREIRVRLASASPEPGVIQKVIEAGLVDPLLAVLKVGVVSSSFSTSSGPTTPTVVVVDENSSSSKNALSRSQNSLGVSGQNNKVVGNTKLGTNLLSSSTENNSLFGGADNIPCVCDPQVFGALEQPVGTRTDAAWALANLCSGTRAQTDAVVAAGGLDAFLAVLDSGAAIDPGVCDQCVWGLGNLAGDGVGLRDRLLARGLLSVLQDLCAALPGLPWYFLRIIIYMPSRRGDPPGQGAGSRIIANTSLGGTVPVINQ